MRGRPVRFCLLSFSLLLLGVSPVSADLTAILPDMGSLQHWSVFTLGAASNGNQLKGNAYVEGDTGVAGLGNISLRGGATIAGDLYYRSNGTVKMGPDATLTGAQFDNQDAQLDSDMKAALAASRDAVGLDRNFFETNNIQLRGMQNLTVSGAPGDTVVLKLDSFTLRGNSTFTLEGTASTNFIINVTRQFALSGNSQIVLSGGVQWTNVLFNIIGTKGAVSLRKNARFEGIIIANRRTVQLADNASVVGTVIANRLAFSNAEFGGNVTVGHPPLVSP